MKELLTVIVKSIVDNPEEVVINEMDSHQTLVFEVKVAKSDMGKLIGKQGRNISAIRLILSSAAAKLKKRAIFEVRED